MKTLLFLIIISVFITSASYGQANTTLSNLVTPTAINQSLIPNNNNVRDLGTAAKSWRTLYIDSNIYFKDFLFIKNTGTQNAFVGESCGNAITTGRGNAAYGYHALYRSKTNSFNTAVGSFALVNNTATGSTAVGYQAMYSNTTGVNTAVGYQALYSNTIGSPNTAIGWSALYSNTSGIENIAIGFKALFSNDKADYNTAIGSQALVNTRVFYNPADETDYYPEGNTAIGAQAMLNNTGGFFNTAIGYSTLQSNTLGQNNIAIGTICIHLL